MQAGVSWLVSEPPVELQLSPGPKCSLLKCGVGEDQRFLTCEVKNSTEKPDAVAEILQPSDSWGRT